MDVVYRVKACLYASDTVPRDIAGIGRCGRERENVPFFRSFIRPLPCRSLFSITYLPPTLQLHPLTLSLCHAQTRNINPGPFVLSFNKNQKDRTTNIPRGLSYNIYIYTHTHTYTRKYK